MPSNYTQLEHENIKGKLDESGKNNIKQVLVGEELVELREQEQLILDQRSHLNYNIKVKDMSEESRYNRLYLEIKHVQNIIKMICYLAETSFANLLSRLLLQYLPDNRDLLTVLYDFDHNPYSVKIKFINNEVCN